ncbi:MAG: ATP-binding protein, partial [Streptomycetaceae bacterium]|nr:ATP-binding protein [Streptomycetaceae bacterium]
TGAKDEIGQIGDAVATLAQQASDGAKLVYRERQGFERFAEGVTGRAVVLIGVQLHQLEVLMREHDRDPELIGKLYGLDHQTVRLRRQIENLQVLSGGAISNPHEEPAHIDNLLMDAAGEAAGHERVDKHFLADARVIPSVASQLTHVLAELIENGARYSPPDFKVVVRAQQAVHGLTVEIEDRGVGLTPAQYEALNARLARVPLYAEMADNAAQLGLFVVGRLAAQIGLEVTLRRSVYGGTAAIVLIPRSLLVNTADGPAAPPASEMVQHERPETAGGLPVRPLAPRPAAAAAPDPAPVAHNPIAPVAPVAPVVPAPAAPAPAAPAGPRHAAVPEQRPTTPVADAATYRPAEDTGLAPLPRRARGTHLATQLRDETGEVEQAAFAADSPEAARDMYRGLQAAFDQAEQPDRIDNADSAEDTPAPR